MKAVALLSGGIDSPVAAYLMIKQECEVILVHFQNENLMKGAVEDKIQQLATRLATFQKEIKLYIVPFGDLQKEIIMRVPAAQRMLIYRRFMLRIASKIADQEGAEFLITGDSLSQVASQTLENLTAVYPAASKTILTPLIGMDKREITDISRGIGTYEISILPYGDCCSAFVPKHPELRSKERYLERSEHAIDTDKLVGEAVKNARLVG